MHVTQPVAGLACRQDPYCSLQLGKDVLRTKAVKKGGQHPDWDEELRFPLYEDTEDVLVRTASYGDDLDAPPPVPSKATSVKPKIQQGSQDAARLLCR